MSPKSKGRMINRSISDSDKFASLTPQAAVLFTMLIPHFNAYGKLNGGPGYIKDEVCPKINYLSYKNIPRLLKEISSKTNVKWFKHDGRYWIHSIHFNTEHQELRRDRMGIDVLPDYSGTTPGLVRPEVEVEVEVEDKEEGKKRSSAGVTKTAPMPYSEIIADLNAVIGSKYKTDPVTKDIRELIDARLKDGFTLADFKEVHRNMKANWANDEKMKKYLRPYTLYTAKFQGYLNNKPPMTAEEEKKRTEYKGRLRDYTDKREKAQKAFESCPDDHPQKQLLKQRVTDYDTSITKLEALLGITHE